jgi:hypothetical protein
VGATSVSNLTAEAPRPAQLQVGTFRLVQDIAIVLLICQQKYC